MFVDKFGGNPSSAYFAVYDGHGGRQVVDFVTQELHKNVASQLRRTRSVPDALVAAFQETDVDMCRKNIMTSGCTACVCVLREERHARVIYTAHLGDSRAIMSRGGTAVRLTSMTDHKAFLPGRPRILLKRNASSKLEGTFSMTASMACWQ